MGGFAVIREHDHKLAMSAAAMYGNFDIIFDHLTHLHTLFTTLHMPHDVICLMTRLTTC